MRFLAGRGRRGLVPVPREEEGCRRVQRAYADYLSEREQRLWELIEQRTANEDTQEKVHELTVRML